MTMPIGVTAVCPLGRFCLSKLSGESLKPLPWDVTGGGTNGGQLALLSLRCFRHGRGRTPLRSRSQFVLLAEVRQPSRPALNSTLCERHRFSGAQSDTKSRPRTSLLQRFRRSALWVAGRGLLATTMAGDVGGRSCTDAELLLHPELLSQEFLLLTLEQVGRSGPTEDGRAAGRIGRPAGGSWPLPVHSDPMGLASLDPQRKPPESDWNPRDILNSSERVSQTTSAACVQATACGRERLGGEQTGREEVWGSQGCIQNI